MSDGGGDDNGASAAGDEEAYERSARTHQSHAADKKPVDLLPFKTPDGELQFDRSRSRAASALFAGSVAGISIVDDLAPAADAPASEGAPDAAARVGPGTASKPEKAGVAEPSAQHEPPELHGGTGQPRRARKSGASDREEARFQARLAELQDARAFHSRAVRVEQVKHQIAAGGSKLLEDPGEHLPQLRLLLELGLDADSQVCAEHTMSPCASSCIGALAGWEATAYACSAYGMSRAGVTAGAALHDDRVSRHFTWLQDPQADGAGAGGEGDEGRAEDPRL